MTTLWPRSRRSAILPVALALALAMTALALAASPVKGGAYSGRLKSESGIAEDGTPIALKVSPTGTKVTVSMETFPLFCEGGGPPQLIHFKKAKIAGGKFRATGTEKAEKQFGGGLTATAVVTGKFLAKGREKGTFKVSYTKTSACDGSTTYTTKAG